MGTTKDWMKSVDKISGFHGQYRWLSNFYYSPVRWLGIEFKTAEHAYQATKTKNHETRLRIAACVRPGDAKKFGRSIIIRSDWEDIKINSMRCILIQKFEVPWLREKLLATGNAELIETNTWGDRFWGADPQGNGKNTLGKILMELRDRIREKEDG